MAQKYIINIKKYNLLEEENVPFGSKLNEI